MEKKDFTPKEFTDTKALQGRKKSANTFIEAVERAREQYIKIFGEFDYDFFREIYFKKSAGLASKMASKKYVEVKKIDLRGINFDKAMDMGLLNIPDMTDLVENIKGLHRLMYSFQIEHFVRNLARKIHGFSLSSIATKIRNQF